MKFLLFILCSILGIPGIVGQNVDFPDANFKKVLLDDPLINTDGNENEISMTEAQAVQILDIGNKGISNLTGIKYFTNLEELTCPDNLLTNLDLSGMSNLKVVRCQNNSLISLDIRNTPSLKILYATDNFLECIVADQIVVSRRECAFTTLEIDDEVIFDIMPCLPEFEDLPSLVDEMGLPPFAEDALLGVLRLYSMSCEAGNEVLATVSLTSLISMTEWLERAGQMSSDDANLIIGLANAQIAAIRSGEIDCSNSSSSGNILDWIASWFRLQELDFTGTSQQAVEVNTRIIRPVNPDHRSVTLYPNPTQGRLNLSTTVNQAVVYSTLGKQIARIDHTDHLDLNGYAAGIYMVRVLVDGAWSSHRVMVRQ